MTGTIEELIGKERMVGHPVPQPKASKPPALYSPKVEPEPVSDVVTGGGGGLTVRPWWDIAPKSPLEAAERSVETPVISPVGLTIGGGTKIITKTVGMKLLPFVLGGGIGALVMSFLGGGGKQEQEMTISPDIKPEQIVDTTVNPMLQTILDMISKQQQAAPIGDIGITDSPIGAGARVGSPVQYEYSYQYPVITPTQITPVVVTPQQTTPVVITPQQTQEQGIDLMQLAIIGGVILGAAFLLKGKA